MRRLKDYLKVVAWQSGLSYLALWAVTFWTLDEGGRVFGKSGVCHPDAATVLFYWSCDSGSALSILAAVANVALTATVWAPVYVAAATVRPDAIPIAAAIIAVHVIGLPLGLFVLVRMLATALDLRRRLPGRAPREAAANGGALARAVPAAGRASPAARLPSPKPRKVVKPRGEFGLRGGGRH